MLRKRLGGDLGAKVVDVVGGHDRYGLSHALLAALDCPHAVTTNYDELYERAFVDGHRAGGDLHVLPGDAPEPSSPWLVKMHGDVKRPGDIVLARSDFVGYAAKSGPVGAVVQSLLMTEHLLVVGASLSDDNFLRLAHEVLAFRSRDLGTVLKFAVTHAERELWGSEFSFVEVSTPDALAGESARRLAIFLDALAMETASPDHLLDARYQELLTAQEKEIAAQLRDLVRHIDAFSGEVRARWSRIGDVLRLHGAPTPKTAAGPSAGTQPVIVRFLWNECHLAGGERAFVIEVPVEQVPEDWPIRRTTNAQHHVIIAHYLERVATLAEKFPGAVTPGHITCIVTATGELVRAFEDPGFPYSGLRNGRSPLVQLGLRVPDLNAVSQIPDAIIQAALKRHAK